MKNRNKILIILGIALFVVAIIVLLLGFMIGGYDVIGWFSSQYAIWTYVILGIYLLVVLYFIILDKIKNL